MAVNRPLTYFDDEKDINTERINNLVDEIRRYVIKTIPSVGADVLPGITTTSTGSPGGTLPTVNHNHSGASGSGGKLDWDDVWSDAVHDHEDAAGGGQIDHGDALLGLDDDDHTQYKWFALMIG